MIIHYTHKHYYVQCIFHNVTFYAGNKHAYIADTVSVFANSIFDHQWIWLSLGNCVGISHLKW